jgi:4-hydroxybenzoyl-CoA reductase subunit beta
MMRLPPFTYLRPTTAAEAVTMRVDAGPAGQYVAGGTDLFPNMKRRHEEPKVVIGLRNVEGLSGIQANGSVVIGANTSLMAVSQDAVIRERYPALATATSLIATPTLQRMGTLGGNLLLDTRCNYYNQNYEWRKGINFCLKKDGDTCWVAPGSPRCWAVSSTDGAPVAIALGAKLRFTGPDGDKEIDAAALYNDDGIQYTTKGPADLLTAIALPDMTGWRTTYWKLRRRGSFDFPVLGVAAALKLDGDVVTEARIVLGAVASFPYRDAAAEAAIVGTKLADDDIAAAAEAAFKPAKPMDNTDFVLNWRKHMVRQYVRGALTELRDGPKRARAGG